MLKYPRYEVFYLRERGKLADDWRLAPVIPARVEPAASRVPLIIKGDRLVFQAGSCGSTQCGLAFHARLTDVYAAMVALAIHLGVISEKPMPMPIEEVPLAREMPGVLNGKQVAQFINLEIQKVKYVSLDREQIEAVYQKFFPIEKNDRWFEVVSQSKVRQLEDYVVLNREERLEEVKKARRFLKTNFLTAEGQTHRLLAERDLWFATDAAWGFWAIREALNSIPEIRVLSWDVNYATGRCEFRVEKKKSGRRVAWIA